MANPPPPRKAGPSWNGAPELTKTMGFLEGQNFGVFLWGIAPDGAVWGTLQKPEGDWEGWSKTSFQASDLAGAQQNNGAAQMWWLDGDGRLWSKRQSTANQWTGGRLGPNWNKAPARLKRLAASQQGGERGAALWAITDDSALISCNQLTPGGDWSDWQPWLATPENSKFVEIAAAQQGDGLVRFWAIDTNGQLWSRYQTSLGGDWSSWLSPNWDAAPKLAKIAACEMSGTRGQQVWGITPDNMLVSKFQSGVGTGGNGWPTGSWLNAPLVLEVTACLQNNGCVQLWAVTMDYALISVRQLELSGGWTPWDPPA